MLPEGFAVALRGAQLEKAPSHRRCSRRVRELFRRQPGGAGRTPRLLRDERNPNGDRWNLGVGRHGLGAWSALSSKVKTTLHRKCCGPFSL